jgi:hypothetical protein
MSIAILLKRSLPGSKSSVTGHIERGERIAQAIQQRFGISEPRQWQAKHLRWVLERWASEKSEATRYDYWRTVRVLAAALNHWPDWAPHLDGEWCRKGVGGRPVKAPSSFKPRV